MANSVPIIDFIVVSVYFNSLKKKGSHKTKIKNKAGQSSLHGGKYRKAACGVLIKHQSFKYVFYCF